MNNSKSIKRMQQQHAALFPAVRDASYAHTNEVCDLRDRDEVAYDPEYYGHEWWLDQPDDQLVETVESINRPQAVVDAVLKRPFPLSEKDRLVLVCYILKYQ